MEALPVELLALVGRVLARRASLQAAIARGYEDALLRISPLRNGPALQAELPPGMLQALVAAELCGRGEPLEHHYCRAMPAQLAAQLRGRGAAEERLFSTKLELSKLPRLQEGLERLFALVAGAGVSCAQALGASSPEALIAARPTLGELYAGCHFGRSMPMLYAYRGDLADEAWRGRSSLELIDARYVGPLVHELSHLAVRDPALVPAPANLHEALAAWIGSRAWPAQLSGAEDSLPGGAFFASVGGWLARAIGEGGAIRAQAGQLDLSSAQEGIGPDASAALRLYGFLPFLETGATHLLSDAFRPDRWWKLIDLHRDPALAAELRVRCVEPLLRSGPPSPGDRVQPAWDALLDALPLSALPAAREEPGPADLALAEVARQALLVRTTRAGLRFTSARANLKVTLDEASCWLSSDAPGPDAIGAPPRHPYPPALCKKKEP